MGVPPGGFLTLLSWPPAMGGVFLWGEEAPLCVASLPWGEKTCGGALSLCGEEVLPTWCVARAGVLLFLGAPFVEHIPLVTEAALCCCV